MTELDYFVASSKRLLYEMVWVVHFRAIPLEFVQIEDMD